MSMVYEQTGTSRQNFHKRYCQLQARKAFHKRLIHIMHEVRQDHPRMSAKQMYKMINPEGIGRDRFFALAKENGLHVVQKRNKRQTTDSRGLRKLANKIEGKTLTDINQVWVSDITYYELSDHFAYVTIVMDLYSKRILGSVSSRTLKTEFTTLAALKMALHTRGIDDYKGKLIFHSDGGSQYYARDFKQLRDKYGIEGSMAEFVYENAHAERVIGTLKNEYLIPYAPKDDKQLSRDLSKTAGLYNKERPHSSCEDMPPVTFEHYIFSLQQSYKPNVKVTETEKSTQSTVINKKKKEAKKKNL